MYRYLHQLLEAQNWFREPGIIVKTTFGIPASQRRAFIVEKGTRCGYCQATENLTLDHKLARALGGANRRGNLQVLCHPCNRAKAKEETELLVMLGTETGRVELLRQWQELQKEGNANGQRKRDQRALQRAEALRIIAANRAAEKAPPSYPNSAGHGNCRRGVAPYRAKATWLSSELESTLLASGS